ncbi:MAG: FKBP-type peptidyl-prolyl cis-trans isomerase [Prevotella sp.]|nr:FKBP-type peptidyl-prolyl cis-trans isomerase [Prevotella sp.]
MKKVVLLALTLVVGATFSNIDAAKKKKKESQQEQNVKEVVNLISSSDSLSYAAGITMTNGLMPYLLQQGVDTAYMSDFVTGFSQAVKDAVAAKTNPSVKARLSGVLIADQLVQRLIPGLKMEFTDTPDSVIDLTFFRGFTDALQKDSSVMNLAVAETLFKDKQKSNKAVKVEKLSKPGRDFLAENKTKEGVISTPSGLQYKVLKQGEGEVPQRTDKVKVHYEGRLIDGTVFDASSKHGSEPASFRADQVIRGWTEALTMMPVGSKWQLFIPQELAYGERAQGQIPAYSTLIFDVELVEIDKPAPAAPAASETKPAKPTTAKKKKK